MRTVENNCPNCHHKLNGAVSVEDKTIKPEPGDASVCLYCGSFLILNHDLSVRLMTIEEVAELEDDTRITLMRVRRFIEQREKQERAD